MIARQLPILHIGRSRYTNMGFGVSEALRAKNVRVAEPPERLLVSLLLPFDCRRLERVYITT